VTKDWPLSTTGVVRVYLGESQPTSSAPQPLPKLPDNPLPKPGG
jgi:hypothetical protein